MTTGPRLTARPLVPEDTAFAVDAVGAAQPHHPWPAEILRLDWRTSDQMGRRRSLVLEEAGRPAGWVQATMWDEAPEGEGRVTVFLPAAGPEQLDQAWAIVEEAARELGVRLGRASVWEDDGPALEALGRRGWELKRKERFWRLDLAGRAERLLELRAGARRRVEAAGLRIATAADLGGEAVYPDLYRMEDVTAADIPRDTPHVTMAYDAWLEWMRPPAVLPERIWIALSGDRPVGISYLDYGWTPVGTAYTGVLREHRGAGLARALKLETLVQAVELGIPAVETDNDSANAPILHLNEELGYREIPGQVKLHKHLHAVGGGAT
jgi:GNAT superfamily N-acetyltransferase